MGGGEVIGIKFYKKVYFEYPMYSNQLLIMELLKGKMVDKENSSMSVL